MRILEYNRGLLCKWLWRLNDGKAALWKLLLLIITKYLKEGFWDAKPVDSLVELLSGSRLLICGENSRILLN